LYILASVSILFSQTISSLILLRFIQAIGSCAAMVTSVTLVRDLFPTEENAKVFALLILVLGSSPMIAPTIGGYITTAFGWHAVFIVLAVLCAVIFFCCTRWLPDGNPPDILLSLKPGPIIRSFWSVFTEPSFYTYCFAGGIAFMGLFAYVSGSPLVFMNIYGVGQRTYGWIFAFLSIGFIGSSQLNNILLKKFSSQRIIRTVLPVYASLSILFLFSSAMGWLTLPVIILFLFLLLSCVGIVNPNTASLTLAPFTKNAGTASALMGAIQMGLGALISVFISLFKNPSTMPLAMAMTGSSVLALLVLWIGSRRIREKTEGRPGKHLVSGR
jgi:DHA1 family bicyclomycin/chloramphenicol resistance-like MFS transporter